MDTVDLANWLKQLAQRVEALEPENTELAKTKVEIERLRTRVENAVSGAGVVIERLRKELAEAKAELEELRKEYDDAKNAHEAYKTAARDRIYNLRKERDGFRADWGEELRRREGLILAKVAACDAEEAMRADAEIGRLVRGMRVGTRLIRGVGGYGTKETHPCAWFPGWREHPAEALRAIQEVGDDEG